MEWKTITNELFSSEEVQGTAKVASSLSENTFTTSQGKKYKLFTAKISLPSGETKIVTTQAYKGSTGFSSLQVGDRITITGNVGNNGTMLWRESKISIADTVNVSEFSDLLQASPALVGVEDANL